MAQYQNQLQPFEENQSPSPVHEIADPFTKLSLARSRSSRISADPPSSPVNTLHRQLSGDPDAPPPAWKRRASFTQKPGQIQTQSGGESDPATSPNRSTRTSPTTELSPRPNLPPPVSRRHPQLQMTSSTRSMFTHESPNASSTSLYDPALAPPQPAFLRSKGGTRSNRSSIHSTDTNGMTSEDLWNLDVEPIADLSNPQRSAMERPLDTVRRLSQRSERRPVSISPHVSSIMPVDFMWPTAPPEEEAPIRRAKSKSTTSVPSLAGRQVRLGRKKTSADPQTMSKVMQDNQSDMPRSNSVFISGSAHSSTTDLSKGLPLNKSQASLSRPPSTYYSRDFLSQLAPREGGYAIAAMLNSPVIPVQTSPGVVSAEEKRRSANLDIHRGSRPPTSKSAGMGRWSLDGGEHYNRPYATSSANTTQSNLSTAPPITSPQSSPPADDHDSLAPSLPEGASPPHHALSNSTPEAPSLPVTNTSAPIVPSPLSRAVTETSPSLDAADPLPSAIIPSIPVPPTPTDQARPALNTKASKKQLAKDAKMAEKAEAAKVLAQRAARAKEDAAKKQAEKDKAREAKEAAKRKEKDEKERRKLEKRSMSNRSLGENLRSPSQTKLGLMSRTTDVPPVPTSASTSVPFPAPNGASPQSTSNPPVPKQAAPTGSRRFVSMPTGSLPPAQSSSVNSAPKTKLGLFGTLRKRFSTMDSSSRKASPSKPVSRTPVNLDTPAPHSGGASSTVLPTPASTLVQSDSTVDVGKNNGSLGSQGDIGAETQADVVVIDSNAAPQPPAPVEDVTPTPASIPAPAAAEDLPPRTTSIHGSPARVSQSPSRAPPAPPSADSHSNSPPSSSALRARNSIQGPRPMPRSSSVTSRTSRTTPILPSAATLDTYSGESTALSQTHSHLSSSGTYDSQTSQSQSVMTPADELLAGSAEADLKGRGAVVEEGPAIPERGDSADTVRVDYGRSVAAH